MKNEGTHGLVLVSRRLCLRRTLPQQTQHCASRGDLHPTPTAFLLKPLWTTVSRCSFIGCFKKGYDEGAPETILIDGSSWFYHSLLHRLRIAQAFCAQRHMHATELVETCPPEVPTEKHTFHRVQIFWHRIAYP